MSASQTLHLIEKLTEADIPKETATELLEFVEKRQTNLVTEDYLEARMAATDAKIDKLDMKVVSVKNELNGKTVSVKNELDAKIDKLDAKIDKLDMKIVSVKNELNGKIESVKDELNGKIESVKNELNGKITGIMLFLGFNTTLLAALIILMLRMSFG